ncbi:MAG: hypothetical protein ACO1O6_13835 [Bacteroidota bacterium]
MQVELDKIISSFKDCNQSLRKRAITIGVLMILTISLRYSENVRYEDELELIYYRMKLEEIVLLPDADFKQVIDKTYSQKYFGDTRVTSKNDTELEHRQLFNRVKFGDYQKSIFQEGIDDVIKRIDELHTRESIGIIGLTVPIEPITYLSLVFVLILFHDFTQIIVYRNQIHRKIRRYNIPHWKLGFEFFGFYNSTSSSSLKFLRFTSTLISGALILCPLATSFLMLDFYKSNNPFLTLFNIFCFILIIVDTVIILYSENVANFRTFSNFYLGKYNRNKWKMKIVWSYSLLFILMLNFFLCFGVFASFVRDMVYFVLLSIPQVLLYIYLNITYSKPSLINRAIRSGLLVLNGFWIYACSKSLINSTDWEAYDLMRSAVILFFGFLASIVYMFVYSKYFIRTRQVKGRLLNLLK